MESPNTPNIPAPLIKLTPLQSIKLRLITVNFNHLAAVLQAQKDLMEATFQEICLGYNIDPTEWAMHTDPKSKQVILIRQDWLKEREEAGEAGEDILSEFSSKDPGGKGPLAIVPDSDGD